MDKFDIACEVLKQAASEASDYAEDGDRSDREVSLEALRLVELRKCLLLPV